MLVLVAAALDEVREVTRFARVFVRGRGVCALSVLVLVVVVLMDLQLKGPQRGAAQKQLGDLAEPSGLGNGLCRRTRYRPCLATANACAGGLDTVGELPRGQKDAPVGGESRAGERVGQREGVGKVGAIWALDKPDKSQAYVVHLSLSLTHSLPFSFSQIKSFTIDTYTRNPGGTSESLTVVRLQWIRRQSLMERKLRALRGGGGRAGGVCCVVLEEREGH